MKGQKDKPNGDHHKLKRISNIWLISGGLLLHRGRTAGAAYGWSNRCRPSERLSL
jgi:hypothetical protein